MSETQHTSILLADDDANIRALLHMELEAEGHQVMAFEDGVMAMKALRESPPSLALLDWNMPGMTGLDICRRLRETGVYLPVIMITARDEMEDRIAALDSGADDFISKPFNIREVIARVRALLRRSSGFTSDEIQIGDLMLNCAERSSSFNGISLRLSIREFDLLECLMRHHRQAMTRSQLIQHVWGDDYFGDDNVVDVYISYLRRKLETAGSDRIIHTVRGIGFSLRLGDR